MPLTIGVMLSNRYRSETLLGQGGMGAVYRVIDQNLNLRGALFLEEARRQLGDEAFLGFLQEYAILYDSCVATADDLFAVMRNHSPIDIKQLKTTFFRQ